MSSTGQYQTAISNNSGILKSDYSNPSSFGSIYVSKDYGITWNTVNNTNNYWCSVSMSADGQYQIATVNNGPIASSGYIYYSTDYGLTWNISSSGSNDYNLSWNFTGISANAQYLTILGGSVSNSNIYTSVTPYQQLAVTNGFNVLSGDSVLNDRLFVLGDVSMGSNLYVNNDLTILGRLNVQQYTQTNIIYTNVTTTNYSLVITEDISVNGHLFVSSDVSMGGNLFGSGTVTFTNTTPSVSNTTGAVIIDGGLGVGGSIYAGSIYTNGVLVGVGSALLTEINPQNFVSTVSSTSPDTGAITIAGGLGVAGNVFVGSNVGVIGDLSVNSRLYVIGDSSFSGMTYLNKISEKILSIPLVSTSYTFDFLNGSAILFLNNLIQTTNYTVNFINVPAYLYQTFTISIMSLSQFYCNAITISNNANVSTFAFSPKYLGNIPPVVSSSSTIIVQSFSIINTNVIGYTVLTNVNTYA